MSTTTSSRTDRFLRQQELVPRHTLNSVAATVIGVGAIGVPHLQLVDFDVVDPTNVTTQGYSSHDIGRAKVQATQEQLRRLDPSVQVEALEDRFRPRQAIGSVVFCCVDSISVRAAVWRSLQARCEFWADGRMRGETIRVLVAVDEVGRAHYPTTLFAAGEADPGRCTARSTIYTANIAAGLMVHQFVRWLRRQPADPDSTFNLLANEITLRPVT